MTNEEVGRALIARGETITSAESLTAGMFVSTLAGVSGISAVLPGAFVTYAAAAKTQLIGVPADMIATYGVVSAEVAKAMATGAKAALQTAWGISFTGVAGPDALEGHPAGTVFIGLASPDGSVVATEHHFAGDRQTVREASVAAGFAAIATKLAELAK